MTTCRARHVLLLSAFATGLGVAGACSEYAESAKVDADGGESRDGDLADATGGDGGATDSAPAGTHHDIADPAHWECFNLNTINFTTPSRNAVSDGRFVYYGSGSSKWVRFDRSKRFAETAAWTPMEAKTVDPAITISGSLTYDGRYVFYALDTLPRVARFDTIASADKPFGDLVQWTTLNAPDSGPASVRGGVVAKTGPSVLVYSSPTAAADASVASRFAPDGMLWETFDVTKAASNATGDFTGGRFDSRYVYWLGGGDVVLRYDTTLAFDNASAWQTFNPGDALKNPTPPQPMAGFSTTAFDNRHLYFAPRSYATVLRYDTTATFSAAGSWAWHRLNQVGDSFLATAFDGRFVYFIPGSGATRVARYDIQADFASDAAWSSFDLASKFPTGISGFGGATFDGRWVYLVPNNANTTCRFDAVAP